MSIIRRRCPHGCGSDKGFCRCGKGGRNDRLMHEPRVVRNGRNVSGSAQRTSQVKKWWGR